MIETIAPAKAVQLAAPFFEKAHDIEQSRQALDAPARVPFAAGMRPTRIALFAAGAKRDDFRLALRSAPRAERDLERKPDLMERRHYSPLRPRATARARVADICASERRK